MNMWYKTVGRVIALTFILIGCNTSNGPVEPKPGKSETRLYINEINARNGESDWLELYNPGVNSVDLEGFRLYDDELDKYNIPQGLIIEGGGFLLFYCDGEGVGNHTNFRLTRNGESVVFEDATGKVIDVIEFPELKSGQFYGRFPDGESTLYVSGYETPESSNGDAPGPLLLDVERDPLVPSKTENITISVEAFHELGTIDEVTLNYRIDDREYLSVSMQKEQDRYYGIIPAILEDGLISFFIHASNQSGIGTRRPYENDDQYTILISSNALPELKINEFMAKNDACCADLSGGESEFDDWIEIYNAGTVAIDLGGYYVSDNPNDPFKYQIPGDEPSETTVSPGGFILLWADGQSGQGPLHVEFKLSAGGEDIGLYYLDGRQIDHYQFGPQTADVSEGRSTDGGSSWVKFQTPTPGLSNE